MCIFSLISAFLLLLLDSKATYDKSQIAKQIATNDLKEKDMSLKNDDQSNSDESSDIENSCKEYANNKKNSPQNVENANIEQPEANKSEEKELSFSEALMKLDKVRSLIIFNLM
jgi:hypothetical protein